MVRMISVPETILKKISKASRAFQDLEDELEDFLLVSDRDFLAKMRRSRKAHIESETRLSYKRTSSTLTTKKLKNDQS